MKQTFFSNKMGKGEPMIWFTGMGMAIGLIMIVGLLTLIVVAGTKGFWPKQVIQIEIQDNETHSILAGEVILKQTKKGSLVEEDKQKKEWQIFKGNKETYGEAFVFVDEQKIKKKEYPHDILMMERLEYGRGVGFPVMLKIGSQQTFDAKHPLFDKTFSRLIDEVKDRWDKIYDIEKNQIGKINRKIEKINITGKDLQKKDQLQKDYELLAQKAQELREEQKKDIFIYRLASGEEKEIALGQILHAYYPNQLSWSGRLGLFFSNFWNFLSQDPREANTEGGIFPALFGTFVMTILMSLFVTPFGILAAIYLKEYAKQGFFVRLVRIAINNLAGVPSIVFGVFGVGFFVYTVGGKIDDLFFSHSLPNPTFGTGGMLWASLTLALLTLPVVIVATEEALSSVSQGLKEASLAGGASKWQTVSRVILPVAAPGVLTGVILAMARGAGEVAPLMLVGVVKLAPTLPINAIFPFIHLDQKFMHLGFHIYDLGFQSPDSEAARPMVFATTLFLILLVVVMNLGAMYFRQRLRRKYVTGAF